VQKGKALHCALPLNALYRPGTAVIVVISLLLSGNAPGMAVRGQPPRPGGYLDPFFSLVRDRYALCYSSCAEPYGIDDLRFYQVLVGTRIERFALWVLWDARAHPLYRLDELRLRVCLRPFGLSASIALEPLLWREAVKGFPSAHSAGFAAALVLSRTNLACSLRREFAGRSESSPTLVACSARVHRFSLTAVGCVADEEIFLLDVEGELSIGGLISFRTGYRLDTEEIRCGLGCRRERMLVTALWAHHPALGRTISLGVGYVWPR
jgi:hypothetical protein